MISSKFHWSAGLGFLIASIEALFYNGPPELAQKVSSSLMVLLFFSCLLLLITKPRMILNYFAVIAIADAFIMIFRFFYHHGGYPNAWWVVTNASLDACFVALMSPIIWGLSDHRKIRIACIVVTLLAIILAKSNTAILMVFSIILTYCVSRRNLKHLFSASFATLLVTPVICVWLGPKLMTNMGRYHNWQNMMTYWYHNMNLWIGAGQGTYWGYAASLQAGSRDIFLWMHNDWLQVLFEGGIIFFTSMLILYFFMLKKSVNRPELFSMVIAYGLIAMTLYPLHLFVYQMVGTVLVYCCFREEISLA